MQAFVTWPYAAMAVAAAVLLAGVVLLVLRRKRLTDVRRGGRLLLAAAGYPMMALGGLLLIGALAARLSWSRFEAANPAPGKMVDVGGYRIHVLCEGSGTSTDVPASSASGTAPSQKPQPTVLWLPGGYGQGLWMKPLHDAMKSSYRSCLIDRAGTGWSDAAPTPRRIQTLVQEFAAALDGAGERGQLVIVGHSLGGALAANFAALHPKRMAGIVTLDPTPQALLPEAVAVWLGDAEPSQFNAWAVQFGATTLLPQLNPLNTRAWRDAHPALQPVIDTLAKLEERPSALLAGGPAGYWTLADAYGVIRTPGALGELPVLSIVQPTDPDDPQVLARTRQWLRLDNEFEVGNWRAIQRAAANEYPKFSSRGVLIKAPAGTTHDFPSERPDFVLAQVRQFLAGLP